MTETAIIALDIGSTVVKLARTDASGNILSQNLFPRDFESGIVLQVEKLLDAMGVSGENEKVLVCSSANGGLRVGIVSLTEQYSGATLRNQVLSAGANPVFVDDLNDAPGNLQSVDILLIGGGIDCPDAGPLRTRLERFDVQKYYFKTLVFAGNRFLSGLFQTRFPDAVVIDNPLSAGLRASSDSVFESLRRAYLDDLVHKEGVSDLRNNLASGIRPTPEVVNQGFYRAVFNRTSMHVASPCVLVDIGGATTDMHYTVDIVRDDSADRPSVGASVARYVFTDLGIVSSRDSALLELRNHPRLFDFLNRLEIEDRREVYRLLREGEYDPTPGFMSYACLFLALDRFIQGQNPGLPAVDLHKVAQFILTGGAAQNLSESGISRLLELFFHDGGSEPYILIDRDYRVWVDGISCSRTE